MSKKWNVKATFESLAPESEVPKWLAQAIADELENPIPNLAECEKSVDEKELISSVQKALTAILEELDLPPITIEERRIHVLKPSDYEACEKLRGKGISLYGHAYVRRQENKARLLHELTHEMLHAASFTNILHRYWKERREGKDTHNLMAAMRCSGFSFTKKGEKFFTDKKFAGLNEAVIELLAMKIRERIMGRAEEERLSYAYPHPVLLNEIIDEIATPDEPRETWVRRLYRDLFTGAYSSLKAMGTAWRKTHKTPLVPLISRMDETAESAVQTAEALGLNDLADRLKQTADSQKERML
jgi:hypothetical protein